MRSLLLMVIKRKDVKKLDEKKIVKVVEDKLWKYYEHDFYDGSIPDLSKFDRYIFGGRWASFLKAKNGRTGLKMTLKLIRVYETLGYIKKERGIFVANDIGTRLRDLNKNLTGDKLIQSIIEQENEFGYPERDDHFDAMFVEDIDPEFFKELIPSAIFWRNDRWYQDSETIIDETEWSRTFHEKFLKRLHPRDIVVMIDYHW